MKTKKPEQIDTDEWLYKGCFIQKQNHPRLKGNYFIFKNDELQTFVNSCYSFKEAKIICEKNECFVNFLIF